MNLQFGEIMAILLFLAIMYMVFLIIRQHEQTNEKLEKSYPPDTKTVLETLGGIVVNLAAGTSNKYDDLMAQQFVGYLRGKGIELPPDVLEKIGMAAEVKAQPPMTVGKAPELA